MFPDNEETVLPVHPEPLKGSLPLDHSKSAAQPLSAVMIGGEDQNLVAKPEVATAMVVSAANKPAEAASAVKPHAKASPTVDHSRSNSSTLNPLAPTFSTASSIAADSPPVQPCIVDSSVVQSWLRGSSAGNPSTVRPKTACSKGAESSATNLSTVGSSATSISSTSTNYPPAHSTPPKRPNPAPPFHALQTHHQRDDSWSSATSSIAEAKKSFQGAPPLSLAADMHRRRSHRRHHSANHPRVPQNAPTAPASMNYDAMPRPLPPPLIQSYMSSQQALAAGHATLMKNDREYSTATVAARKSERVVLAPDFIPGSRIPYTHFTEGVYYNVFETEDGEVWVPAGAPIPAGLEKKTPVEGSWGTRKGACGFDGEWEEEGWGGLLRKLGDE